MAAVNPLDESWKSQANCRGREDLFFPTEVEGKTTFNTVLVEKLRAICKTCPVKGKCYDYAMEWPGRQYGFWGGTTEQERERVKRKGQYQKRLERNRVWTARNREKVNERKSAWRKERKVAGE